MPRHQSPHRVADHVRELVESKGINQTDFGAQIGLSQHAVSRRLLGRVEFTIRELKLVAAALDVPLADLLIDSEDDAGETAAS